mgnify:CR=1 FL=1
MELRETGKPGAAAVLLWPNDGLDAAVFASVVRLLGKSCRVLVPVFAPEEPPDARVAAVESALQAFGYAILKEHMETCVVEEIRKGNTAIVEEAVDLVKKLK